MSADVRPVGQSVRERDSELERRWKKKKKARRVVLISSIIAIVVIAIAAFLVHRFYRFKNFELVSEKNLNEGSFVGIERYADNIVKFSHDGASYIDRSGEAVWVDSYEMRNPKVCTNAEYLCIADVDGNDIKIYNEEGPAGSVKTTMPVTKAVVSQTGVCAAIQEDKTSSYIMFYRKDGSPIDITIKSAIAGDGYPVDISLSPEGTQLMASYVYVNSGKLKSRVVFYDFSEIGKNVPNRLVGGFEGQFEDSLVARVKFIDSVYSYAVADSGLYFFSSQNLASPELISQVQLEDMIKTVFNCGSKVGVVVESSEGESEYKLMVYKANGELDMEIPLDIKYTHISGDDNYVYITGENRCILINRYGYTKADVALDESAYTISKGRWPGRFVFSGPEYIREYQFK